MEETNEQNKARQEWIKLFDDSDWLPFTSDEEARQWRLDELRGYSMNEKTLYQALRLKDWLRYRSTELDWYGSLSDEEKNKLAERCSAIVNETKHETRPEQKPLDDLFDVFYDVLKLCVETICERDQSNDQLCHALAEERQEREEEKNKENQEE